MKIAICNKKSELLRKTIADYMNERKLCCSIQELASKKLREETLRTQYDLVILDGDDIDEIAIGHDIFCKNNKTKLIFYISSNSNLQEIINVLYA